MEDPLMDLVPPEEYVVLWSFTGRWSEEHLSISKGDQLMVHAKITPEWWWAELRGVFGYVPASYLRQGASEEEEEKEKEEDAWQDEEYYSTYGTLVNDLEYCYTIPESSLGDVVRQEPHRDAQASCTAGVFRQAQVQSFDGARRPPRLSCRCHLFGHAHVEGGRPGGNAGQVSVSSRQVWCVPRLHPLVQCLLQQPGGGRRASGAEHRT